MLVVGAILSFFTTWVPVVGWLLEQVLDRFDIVWYKRKLSWRNVERGILRLKEKIRESGFKPDLLVGSGRPGSILCAWLAGELGNHPFAAVDVECRKMPRGTDILILPHGEIELSGKQIVLILSEDKTGDTANKLIEFLKKRGVEEENIRCATLLQYRESIHKCDYYAYKVDRGSTVFPWRLTQDFPPHS